LLTPEPVQVKVKVVVAFSVAVIFEPLMLSEPLQPPEAVQEVAPLEVHDSRVEVPGATADGSAVSVTAIA
jgi:hypothetical protein